MNFETIETNKHLFEICEHGGKWWVDKTDKETGRRMLHWRGPHKSRKAIIRRINNLGR
jgi:hypothetical protein